MNELLNGCLYVVATPIGNRDDITRRAIDTLTHVDLIYAEDTRQTHKLLQFLGIKNTIYQLHKHNEASQKYDIAKQLDKDKSVAIVSDAGTPLIADPGYVTLAYLREKGGSPRFFLKPLIVLQRVYKILLLFLAVSGGYLLDGS